MKNILKKNEVKNYSKLNKKDLIKKINQFINNKSGGGPGLELQAARELWHDYKQSILNSSKKLRIIRIYNRIMETFTTIYFILG